MKCRHIRPEHPFFGFEQRQCKNYTTYHSWYSQQFEDDCKEPNHHSSVAYLNNNFDRVKQVSFVTCTHESQETSPDKLQCLQWEDLQYRGKVIKWDGLGLRAEESEEDPADKKPEGPAKRRT